ncbi:MAG: type II secretion system F family protein [Candidatus Hydrogenedentes bacterium]|nr:type II secretion system F family protein [Candidatus Hydrogenedentota bacterium]
MGILSSEIATKSLVPLCRQLATSYDAGIPIVRSLALAGENAPDRKVRDVLRAIADDATAGATLGEAAFNQRKYLPMFFVTLLKAGEHSGRLDVMLRDLADYYEDKQKMTREVVGALVYPGIQLCFAWFLGTFALGLIGKLSLDARNPFNISDYFQQYLAMQSVALVIFAAVIAAIILFGRFGVIGRAWGFLTTHIWPASVVTRKFALARFFRSMSLLVGSGMNIKLCIQHSAAMTGNAYMERDLLRAIPPIAEGATLVQAFSGSRSLTSVAREMLAVGEHSGALEVSLLKVAHYHQEEAKAAIRMVARVLQAAITLAIGGLVGYIVISFYSKYFSLYDQLL